MASDSIPLEEKNTYEQRGNGKNQEVIVIDGRSYENNINDAKEIYTLVDVVEDNQSANNLNQEIIKRADAIIEKIARQIIPEIAERIIKKEIEDLKK
jgi:hypothetical protein